MIKTLLFIIYYYKTCLKGKLQNKSFHIKNFFFTYKLQLFFLSPLYSFVSNPDLFLRFIFYSFLLLTDFFHCQKLKPDPCALQREDSMLPVGSLSLLSTQQNLESAGRRACIRGIILTLWIVGRRPWTAHNCRSHMSTSTLSRLSAGGDRCLSIAAAPHPGTVVRNKPFPRVPLVPAIWHWLVSNSKPLPLSPETCSTISLKLITHSFEPQKGQIITKWLLKN